MKEQVFSIQGDSQLIGVLTQSDSNIDEKLPVILLLNSGLLNRTGPFRLYVKLARELAQLGFSTFRFDLSGVGDSERHRDKRTRDEQHLADIRRVMDFWEKQTTTREFVVMGICTGADDAHKAMLNDNRIIGAVCIDGYVYTTRRYIFNFYFRKIFRLSSWLTLIKRFFQTARKSVDENTVISSAESERLKYRWEMPEKEKVANDFRAFIKRDARLLNIYTSGWPCNYAQQLADAFPTVNFGSNIQAEFLEGAEHTFPVEADRNRLINAICYWLKPNFLRSE